MAKQYGFYINSRVCSGCKTCMMACKDKHDLEVGRKWRRVYEVTGGDWVKNGNVWNSTVFAYNLSMSCNHCAEPVCVAACPTGAHYKRDDGIVVIDPDKCIGCRYCEWVCPYSAPQYDAESGVMTKCDFCLDNLEAGLPPACVASCPMRAIEYDEIETLREKYGDNAEVFPMPLKRFTNPNIVLSPHKDAQGADSSNAEVANREEV